MAENKDYERQEVYSKRVRAGKRTYFFDVKATRSNDYYLTITESKKRYQEDGFYYEKHKIFLYKQDFDKFQDALSECIDYIRNNHEAGSDLPDYSDEQSDELSWE